MCYRLNHSRLLPSSPLRTVGLGKTLRLSEHEDNHALTRKLHHFNRTRLVIFLGNPNGAPAEQQIFKVLTKKISILNGTLQQFSRCVTPQQIDFSREPREVSEQCIDLRGTPTIQPSSASAL